MNIAQHWTTYPAVVGRILAMLREQHGMEQSEIAQCVGLSQSTWSRIERGESAFTIEQLATAAAAFNTLPSRILEQSDSATAALEKMNVVVDAERPNRDGSMVLTIVGVAALGFLIARALSR